jgi:simple sugar transport system permease protein
MGVSPDQIPVYKAAVVVIIVALQSTELKRMVKRLQTERATGKKVA